MNQEAELLALEEKFWKGDAEFFRRHATQNCLMIFPEPAGIMTRERAAEGIGSAPRWSEVRIEGAQVIELTESAAILVYRVYARRPGGAAAYRALVSSGYVVSGGHWKLAFHQQTPAGAE